MAQTSTTKHSTRRSSQRPTIGLLTYGVEDPNNDAIWSGVADVARLRGSNLICFPGKPLRSPVRFNAQANVLYDLVSPQNLDGLVIWVGALAHHVPVDEVLAFCQRYQPLPMTSVALLLDGIPSVVVDWYQIVHEAMSHLIEVHGRRRIAFIRGPQGHPGPEKRFHAYQEILAAYDISFDPRLIASGFLRGADGIDGVRQLLDGQQTHFDAIIAMDEMALGAIAELQRRGLHVPDEVAVIGLNGVEESKYATPPLTSVPFHAYEQAQRATEILFDLLDGRAAPAETALTAKIVVRQSCGCQLRAAFAEDNGAGQQRHEIVGLTQQGFESAVLEAMVQSVRGHRPNREWAAQLLNAFLGEIEDERRGEFLAVLSTILHRAAAAGHDLLAWQGAISALRTQFIPALDTPALAEAEELWHQAHTMIAEMAERVQGHLRNEGERHAATLGAVIQRFVTTYEIQELVGVLATELPRLGIPSCYLALYEDPAAPAAWSRLILAYDESGRRRLPKDGVRFRSQQLTPSGFLPTDRQYEMVVEPLYFRNEQIGFAIFEVGPRDGMLYETLRRQISSAVRGALLFEHNAELYAEALAAKAVAEKADKLKTRLLANVSHELRHPLNVILGYTEQRPTSGMPDTPSALPHIHQSAEHLLRLINDLLDLSRAEIDELPLYAELIDSHTLLSDLFHDMRASSSTTTGVEWRLELPARLPHIQADPVRLRQILLNLLSNAHKFTTAGCIQLGAEVAAPYLHIWVEDSGPGIPIAAQESIFEPFSAAEQANRRQGIGLGLSITRRLVALHRGHMSLESQPGRGSAFHVYLPLPTLSDQPAALSSGGEPALLYVSSADQPAAEIGDIAQRQGLALKRVTAETELTHLLADAQPHLLAWDLTNAAAEEWMIVQQLRHHAQLSHLPFILYGQQSTADAALTTGMTNFLLKPVRAENLQAALSALAPAHEDGPILIVDDDPQMRAFHLELIAATFPGRKAVAVADGASALNALVKETPALVILDLMMPEVDGFDVLDQMRADPKTRRTPVVIVSGRSLTADDVARLEQHAQVMVQSKDVLSPAETVETLQRALVGDNLLPPNTSALVKRGLSYIHQHYRAAFSRQELATAVGASENYLTEVFRREMGISPWEYLNRYRVIQAQTLLRESDASISAIAEQVGFNDSSYFGRVFRKQAGLSPSAYRKAHR